METALIRIETKILLVQLKELVKITIGQHDEAKRTIKLADRELALKVLKGDKNVDAQYIAIKAEVEFAIAKRPLGQELRRVLGYLLIAKELEKIADYAKYIAKFVIKQEDIVSSSKERIRKIHKPFREMLLDVEKALIAENVKEAIKLANKDEKIDTLHQELRLEIISSMAAKSSKEAVKQRMFTLNVIDAIERAADHIVSICETIAYIKTGSHTPFE